jgi:hypothetical protein
MIKRVAVSFAVKIIHDDLLQQTNTQDVMHLRKSIEQKLIVSPYSVALHGLSSIILLSQHGVSCLLDIAGI